MLLISILNAVWKHPTEPRGKIDLFMFRMLSFFKKIVFVFSDFKTKEEERKRERKMKVVIKYLKIKTMP